MENKKLNELFNYVQVPLPSVKTARRNVESISSRVQLEIFEKLNNKNIFLIIDETEINSTKYCNTLAGVICLPHQTWLVDSRSIYGSINSTVVVNVIQDAFKCFNKQPDKFCIIISNSAIYD